jgi:hypothetical protein
MSTQEEYGLLTAPLLSREIFPCEVLKFQLQPLVEPQPSQT